MPRCKSDASILKGYWMDFILSIFVSWFYLTRKLKVDIRNMIRNQSQ